MRLQKITVVLAMLACVWAAGHWASPRQRMAISTSGTWKGTWEGAGAGGRFDLTFAKGGDGKLAASVSVGSDMGDYNAKFSTVTVTGEKLEGAYDYPPDPQGEVTITGSFDAKNATGTWSLGAKGQAGRPGDRRHLESDEAISRPTDASSVSVVMLIGARPRQEGRRLGTAARA